MYLGKLKILTSTRFKRSAVLLLAAFACALLAILPFSRHGLTVRNQNIDDDPIRLQLEWSHQAQFAGIYVAEELGFFKDNDINVTIKPGGPGINPLASLLDKQSDVAYGWLSHALEMRRNGAEIVNIAQILKKPGTMLVCREDSGVGSVSDIAGKKIGTWFLGDQFDVGYWLSSNGLDLSDIQLVNQRPNAEDLLAGNVDCATAMTYNEFLTILRSKHGQKDFFALRFGSSRADGFLEDGLYVRANDLKDPVKCKKFALLLASMQKGWSYAEHFPNEAVAITRRYMGSSDTIHQRQMLTEVLKLIETDHSFGMLSLSEFDKSIHIVGNGIGDINGITNSGKGAWTFKVWLNSRISQGKFGPLGPASRHRFNEIVKSRGFVCLDFIGTASFALSGLLQAFKRRYDIWGCFILCFLPAVGGGTLRDLLIGGMRSPPFIFKDGSYILIVFFVMLIGVLCFSLAGNKLATQSPLFRNILNIFDSIGLATFTIIGCGVAIQAGLEWWWMAICAALTCAGGGTLLDIVTGKEPRTFKGEVYEEIAVVGAIVMFMGLRLSDLHETSYLMVPATLVMTWLFVFIGRLLLIRFKVNSIQPRIFI